MHRGFEPAMPAAADAGLVRPTTDAEQAQGTYLDRLLERSNRELEDSLRALPSDERLDQLADHQRRAVAHTEKWLAAALALFAIPPRNRMNFRTGVTTQVLALLRRRELGLLERNFGAKIFEARHRGITLQIHADLAKNGKTTVMCDPPLTHRDMLHVLRVDASFVPKADPDRPSTARIHWPVRANVVDQHGAFHVRVMPDPATDLFSSIEIEPHAPPVRIRRATTIPADQVGLDDRLTALYDVVATLGKHTTLTLPSHATDDANP